MGDHRGAPSATPTTRCCPRRSRSGRWRCSATCCRATSRSSTRSTGASSTRCARRFPATTTELAADVAHRRERRAQRAHGAPRRASAATRSTASRRCTRELLKETVLRDFYELWPEQVQQQDQRRHAAPLPRAVAIRGSRSSLTRRIGDGWTRDLERARAGSSRSPRTPAFREEWRAVKRAQQGAARRHHRVGDTGITVDPDSMFDVQVKRIHEYKRQHLNVLHVDRRSTSASSTTADVDIVPAHGHLRRQGRARLLHGQADHQAHQRRRRGRQRRPRRSATVCASCSSPTST